MGVQIATFFHTPCIFCDYRYRQTRYSARRMRKRVIFKHGECNVVQGNVAKRRRRYMQDLFTTLVDAQWRWTLMVFSMSFLLSWTTFAFVWWLISLSHGDFDYQERLEEMKNSVAINSSGPVVELDYKPCITNVNGFMSCFLFSVETQHTIGYGNRYINEECPEAIFVMCLQSIMGVFIQVLEGEELREYSMDNKSIIPSRHLWWE